MPYEFKLPDIGEGLHEGEIVRWLVKEGDRIEEDQPIVEVQTDKAVVELPSPKGGVVLKLHAREGEVVKVGEVLVTIGEPGEQPAAAPAAGVPAAGREAAAEAVAAAYRQGAVDAAAEARPAAAPVPGRVLATPATRRLARELGVDLTQVRGTGPGGRITDEDVRRAAAARDARPAAEAPAAPQAPRPAAAPAPAPAPRPVLAPEEEERVPLRGIRRTIAERMVRSKFTAPHVTHMDEVDVTELVALRESALPLAAQRGVKLTYLPFIVKAVIAGLREFPQLNAHFDDERQELVIKRYYHIGIATDTEDGLIVPVVKHADRRSILELAAEIQRLAERARARQATVDELRGSTFTITNIGALGGVFATPILNYPEVAILGVFRIRDRAAVVDGAVVPRKFMTLALSFDHRVIDGALAARFLNRVMQYLEKPTLLFMELV